MLETVDRNWGVVNVVPPFVVQVTLTPFATSKFKLKKATQT